MAVEDLIAVLDKRYEEEKKKEAQRHVQYTTKKAAETVKTATERTLPIVHAIRAHNANMELEKKKSASSERPSPEQIAQKAFEASQGRGATVNKDDEILNIARRAAGLETPVSTIISAQPVNKELADTYHAANKPNSTLVRVGNAVGDTVEDTLDTLISAGGRAFNAATDSANSLVNRGLNWFNDFANTMDRAIGMQDTETAKKARAQREAWISDSERTMIEDKQAFDADYARVIEEATAGKGKGYSTYINALGALGQMLATSMMANVTAGNSVVASGLSEYSALAGKGLKELSNLAISSNAAGQSYIDAMAEGAGSTEAASYALLSGALEYGTNKLFGGNPILDRDAGAFNKLVGKITNNEKLLSFLGSMPVELVGEGVEEAISEIMSPVLQRLTYNPDADFATLEQIVDSAIQGILVAGLAEGGQALSRMGGRGTNTEKPETLSSNEFNGAENAPGVSMDNSIAEPGRVQTGENESGMNRRATNADVDEYMRTGRHKSTRDDKVRDAEAGRKVILTSPAEVSNYIEASIAGEDTAKAAAYGKVGAKMADDIYNISNGNIEVENWYLELSSDDISHAYKGHRNAKQSGNIALSEQDFLNIPDYIDTYDDILSAKTYKDGTKTVLLGKKINGYSVIVEVVSNERKSVRFKNMWGLDTDTYESRYENRRSTASRAARSSENANEPLNPYHGASPDATLDGGRPGQKPNTTGVSSVAPSSTEKVPRLPDANAPWVTAYTDSADTSSANNPIIAQEDGIVNKYAQERGIDAPEGTGAASRGFTGEWGRFVENATDFHDRGMNAGRRLATVTTTDSEGRSISKTAQSAMEARITPETEIGAIESAVMDGRFSFDSVRDQSAITRAKNKIANDGFQRALTDWTADVRAGKVNKDMVALGVTLYNNAINAGDTKTAVDILVDYSAVVRKGAQATQAARILKEMAPEYQLYAAERTAQRIADDLAKRWKEKGVTIELDKELAEEYLAAETDTERADVLDAIYQDIATQIPSTFADKFDALRYLAMLGNLRTHVRNVAGNAAFVPVRTVSDKVAAIGEKLFIKPENRTKSILPADKELRRYARQDAQLMADEISGSGKYNDAEGKVNRYKTAFKNNGTWGTDAAQGAWIGSKTAKALRTATDAAWKVADMAAKGNAKLLDLEDMLFSKSAYVHALSGAYKARGITAEQLQNGSISTDVIDDVRAYAIRKAQEATYRDANAFSDAIAKLGKRKSTSRGMNAAKKILVEGTLPFKRTPANIIVRGVEYSPVGFLNTLGRNIADAADGKFTGARLIDDIAKNLTGTGLFFVGFALAKAGILNGGGAFDDDDEKKLKELRGIQPYSITIGGKNITIDWLAPEIMPVLVGAEMFNAIDNRGEVDAASVYDTFMNLAEPMLETSMLQGVQDVIDNVRYSEGSSLIGAVAEMALNYFTQIVPTLGGQIERTFSEDSRQSTYSDPNSKVPSQFQYALGSVMNKTPGEYNQIEYVDQLGRTQQTGTRWERALNNFVNPAYIRDVEETNVDKELERLIDAGQDIHVPDKPDKTITYDGEKYALTAEEYERFALTRGQHYYNMAQLVDTETYQKMSDEDKAETLKSIMSLAEDSARIEFFEGRNIEYQPKSSTTEPLEAQEAGIDLADWYKAKLMHDSIDDNKTLSATKKATDYAHWLTTEDYTKPQQELLREQLTYSSGYTAEAEVYDKLIKAGLSSEKSEKLYDGMSWFSNPNDLTKAQYIDKVTYLNNREKLKALSVYLSDSAYQKYATANSYGIDVEDWTKINKAISKLGNVNQENAKIALEQADWLTDEERAYGWAILCAHPATADRKETAASKNPFGYVTYSDIQWVS